MPSRHGGTTNSSRAADLLARLMEGEERWETPDHLEVSFLKFEVETSQKLCCHLTINALAERDVYIRRWC
ncbi:hypothetical protein TNCV_495941 [Trichonephila clavipes]|nr:hypothetical protein TNCV_495941 [Trichonephila clavipes]